MDDLVTKLNSMVLEDVPLAELVEACSGIDICRCDPIFEAPQEFLGEWVNGYTPEPTLENTSFYSEEDGCSYFWCGNTRIKVTEHFAHRGKRLDEILTNVIQYAATETQENDEGELLECS